MEDDPLKCLSEKERQAIDAIITLLQVVIDDKELGSELIGTLLLAIEEWGARKKTLIDAPTDKPQ